MYNAKVADILRLSQRDHVFLRDVEDQMHSFFKLMGPRSYYKMSKAIPVIANAWYYFMTSIGNIQTLGEEYTGTIRIGEDKQIPSKILHIMWLILYVGGESIIDRLLNSFKTKVSESLNLTNEARTLLLKCIQLLKEQKPTLNKIHHSLFYINGKYYNISNRIIGIRYVLLRQWLQDDSFTKSFAILGNMSLFYILFSFVHQIFTYKSSGNSSENAICTSNVSKKDCVLCAENIKFACSTPCGHIFCWNCIYDSLSYQKLCPICREVVSPSRIVFFQNYV